MFYRLSYTWHILWQNMFMTHRQHTHSTQHPAFSPSGQLSHTYILIDNSAITLNAYGSNPIYFDACCVRIVWKIYITCISVHSANSQKDSVNFDRLNLYIHITIISCLPLYITIYFIIILYYYHRI